MLDSLLPIASLSLLNLRWIQHLASVSINTETVVSFVVDDASCTTGMVRVLLSFKAPTWQQDQQGCTRGNFVGTRYGNITLPKSVQIVSPT